MQLIELSKPRSPQSYQFSWFDWFCLYYPPAWLILLNRHWQHYKPDPNGWRWSEYLLFLLPGGFYLALLIRSIRRSLNRLQTRRKQSATETAAETIPDFQPDPTYQKAFRDEILAPIVKHHFRASLDNLPEIPRSGPLIILLNHAGMCFPWDFLCLAWLLGEERAWFVQPLAHPLFFDHLWLKWWLPEGWAQVLGGVRAEPESFEAAVAQNAILLYAPEGWRGLAKGWPQRYHLASFDSSFVRLSVRYQVPILPTICIGSEALHPFAVNVKWMARLVRMPMFPLSPLIPVFVLFPSMGVWAMSARLNYYLQSLWYPWQELPTEWQHSPRRSVLHRLAQQLRSQLQQTIGYLTGHTEPIEGDSSAK